MDHAEALQEIRAGRPRPVYVLYGGEPFLEDEILATLRTHAVPPGTEVFNYHGVEPGPDQLAQAVSLARTLPFLGDRRLVVIKDCPLLAAPRRGSREGEEEGGAEAGEAAGAQEEALLAYLQRPAEFTTLAIVSGGRDPDKRRKVTRAAMGLGAMVECRPLREADAVHWVQVRATGEGKKMNPDACRALVDKAGTHLRSLAAEIAKLVTYVGDAPAITEADVLAAVAGTPQSQVFDLMDAVAEGRTADAMDYLADMFRQGERAFGIIAMMAGHYHRLIEAAASARRGMNAYQVAQSRGQKPFYWEKLIKQARRYPRPELISALERMLAADLALKRGGGDERLIMETLLVDLCTGR